MADYLFELERRLSPAQWSLVRRLEQVGRELGSNLYLCGGPMRDLLAQRPILSLDFILEGSLEKLEKKLLQQGFELLYASPKEGSMRLRWQNARLRISVAHRVHYAPGREPRLEPGSVIEDLRGRGFTLDAIGLSLAPASRGLLLDPANGLADIELRQIRMIHPYIFEEDPARLLRALRLECRLEYHLEERTAARHQAGIEANLLASVAPSSLARELEALAYEPDPAAILRSWNKAELLQPALGKGVKFARLQLTLPAQIPKCGQALAAAGLVPDIAPVVLLSLFGKLDAHDQDRIAKLPLSQPLRQWRQLPDAARQLEKKINGREGQNLSALYDLLHHTPPEVTLWVMLHSQNARAQKKLKEFCITLPGLRERLPIRELRQLGAKPEDPAFAQVLEALFRQMLQGKLSQASELSQALAAEAAQRGLISPPLAAAAAPARPGAARPRPRPGAARSGGAAAHRRSRK